MKLTTPKPLSFPIKDLKLFVDTKVLESLLISTAFGRRIVCYLTITPYMVMRPVTIIC